MFPVKANLIVKLRKLNFICPNFLFDSIVFFLKHIQSDHACFVLGYYLLNISFNFLNSLRNAATSTIHLMQVSLRLFDPDAVSDLKKIKTEEKYRTVYFAWFWIL